VLPEWLIIGPAGNGSIFGTAIVNIHVAQFPFNEANYDPILNPQGVRHEDPPVSAFTAVWTPGGYAPRTVTVRVELPQAGLPPALALLQVDSKPAAPPLGAESLFTFGSVNIPVIPAPPAAAAPGLALLAIAPRRRRPGHPG
jgi:hypothetical protein